MIPFATMTASGRSQSLTAERLINLYPEQAPTGARGQIVLRGTPGLAPFSTVGNGPIRALHVMGAALYAVSGTELYSLDSDGNETLLGSVPGTGAVHTADNGSQLVLVRDNGDGYVWDGATLAQISDPDYSPANSCAFLNQYIVFAKIGSGQFFTSALLDAKSYDALDFATAEARPDNIVQVFVHNNTIWLFGEGTTEVWWNTGAAAFPFERVSGGIIEIGCVANSAATVDAAVHWLGDDGVVYMATGYQPKRISTHAIEYLIRDRTNPRAWTYKDEGHAFYVLGFDEGSVVYDATTGLWHERESFTVGRWRADSYARAYGKHLVGDYVIGRIYEMSLSNYADGANDLQRRAISTPLDGGGDYITLPAVQVEFEHGIGVSTSTLLSPTDMQVLVAAGSNLVALASENLFTYSEEFDHADWTKSELTVSADAANAPDGTASMDKVVESTANSSRYVQQTVDVTTGNDYTVSLYVKAGERSAIRFLFAASGFTSNLTANFDVSTGAWRTSSPTPSAGLTLHAPVAIAGGIYRVSLTATATATVSCNFRILMLDDPSKTGVYTGDGSSGLYLWGAQVEPADEPSTYRKTEGSTVSWLPDLTFVSRLTDGVTIKTGGWMLNEIGLLLPDDTIQLKTGGTWKTYTVATQADSDYLGESTFTISESLIEADQGSDPQVVLDWSDDGGKTWSNEHWAGIGKIGEYRKRAVWRRLGRFRHRVFRLTYSEPTKFTIYGAGI